MLNSRYRNRVVNNLFWQFLQPFTQLSAAAAVVHFSSLGLWGELVRDMLILHFILTFISWGSKEYVLRELTRHPSQCDRIIAGTISDRFWLLLLLLITVFFLPLSSLASVFWLIWGFGLFISRSLEPLVYFRQNYKKVWPLELFVSITLLGLLAIFNRELDEQSLIAIFALSAVLRAAGYSIILKAAGIAGSLRKPKADYLLKAKSFLLLDVSGIFNSRIDLYFSLWLLSADQVAVYQIFTSILIQIQSLANVLYKPLAKPAYRSSRRILLKIQRGLRLQAVWITPLAISAQFVLVSVFYNVQLGGYYYLAGLLFVYPIFGYLPLIYRLFSAGRQRQVMQAGFLGGILKAMLILFLAPWMGMFGLLLAAAVAQWILFAVYFKLTAKYEVETSRTAAANLVLE